MPLLDCLFVVSDSWFEGEIGIEVILIVELLAYLLTYVYSSPLVFRHVGFRVEFGMWVVVILDPSVTMFFFVEVEKICYIEVILHL